MFVGDFFSWWYGDGLNARLKGFAERLARVNDFFSVGLLAQTLFTPFRQLSNGRVKGTLGDRMHAAVDDLISRLIGAAIRFITIIVAGFAAAGALVYGGFLVFGWLLLPVLPLIGIGAAIVRTVI